ncbi:mandelate racemase/muconate lactonizing enzyme family protein [Arundinibacter roseus]|uniref:Mandelate racemase/muconate lactonizing enzyme family protein n=1 Tax=Arundinibacter roseus TaxID=2070510 RepID=A0A4R4KHY8_9BACT|nr:mandelate racemase/muconate lactonizing enzyme family protein [Arundinibacter roseus]TDB67443.1 mandelate racemase/muconate lactonizing enzyme family protein [Arundinibacter roseus]
MNRADFLKKISGAAAVATIGGLTCGYSKTSNDLPAWPLPDLKKVFPDPVSIRSVELLKLKEGSEAGRLLLVVTAKDGAQGMTLCNDRMPNLISLFKGLVKPHFVGKDARDLPVLADNAYRLNSNYKYAGMPLWNCIGSLELATWDLLGQLYQKPVYALLGKSVRSSYEVYISDFYRGGQPMEAVVDRLAQKLEATGATGVKIKVGGRMANTAEDDKRTSLFVPMVRKILGDVVTIYADGNGSFSCSEGINTGKLLEDYGVSIFEEPCNFEDEDSIRQVNQALKKIKLAGGEQDTSLYRFDRLARTGVCDILQPDLYYNGGLLRTLQVAEIARQHGKVIAPHTPKADPLIGPFWQFAALASNLYGLQEFVMNPGSKSPSWYSPTIEVKNGKMSIPNTAGLGIVYDTKFITSAEKVG